MVILKNFWKDKNKINEGMKETTKKNNLKQGLEDNLCQQQNYSVY